MRLPPNEDSIRDYLEWSFRRADALLAAWKLRKEARELTYPGNVCIARTQARVQYMVAMSFKKELNIIRNELEGHP